MARILIYAMNYAPEVAGVGRVTGELGDYLAGVGHQVAVVTTVPHYPGWKVLSPYRNGYCRDERPGVTIERCPILLRAPMGGLWRLIAPLSFAATSALIALRRARRFRPEVILAIEPSLAIAPVALLAARLTGARTVLHVQDLEVDAAFAVGHLKRLGWLRRPAFAVERALLKRFDAVVTIGQAMAERLTAKAVAPQRLAIVRNWVDLEAIRPLDRPSRYRAKLGLCPDAFVVLYSGNLGLKQGLADVMAAARRLAARPDIQFVIAGEGPLKPTLAAEAAALCNVRLLPFQPEASLSEFLGLADLHLLPQSAGAADLVLPSKLGGMLASGKPILATVTPGAELAAFLGEAARIIPPGDVAALAAAIARAADAPDGERGRAARLALAQRLSRADRLPALNAAILGAEPAVEPAAAA